MWIIADVVWDTDEIAAEAARLADEGRLPGISVDLGDVTSELEVLATDDDGFPTDWLDTVTDAEIIGATQVAMPAFADARIAGNVAFLAPEGVTTSDKRVIAAGALRWRDPAPLMFNDTSDGHNGAVFVGNLTNFRRALTAVACPDEWKVDPHLPTLTKPKVEQGRIVGHGAGWGTCHTGFRNACVTAPSSQNAYDHLGGTVKVYQHPNGDHHAPLHLDAEATARWYEAHCSLVGEAAVGEDSHGIWISGAADVEGEVFLSGDWRDIDGNLELVSFLVVDNPGFPTALVASEHQTALVGAGIVTETDRVAQLEARISSLEFELEAQALRASLSA